MSNGLLFTLWTERLVLTLLVALSIWSLAIMIDRGRLFRRLRAQGGFAQAKDLIHRGAPRAEIAKWVPGRTDLPSRTLQVALSVPGNTSEPIDRAVKSFLVEEKTKLERGLTVLATLGSNAPFIGLFGTVLGVLRAFGELAERQRGTEAVMAAISNALVATAVGLFVAIPAVVAYNILSRQLKSLLSECEITRDLFVAHLGAPGAAASAR